MSVMAYEPVKLDIIARPWLAAKPCHRPDCIKAAQFRAGGWTCGDHAALPYAQSAELAEALARGIDMMNRGIYAPRLP